MTRREPKPTFDPEYIRDISEGVYRKRLCRESGPDAVKRMIDKDNDGGAKLRGRAGAYDALTHCYLEQLGFTPKVVP